MSPRLPAQKIHQQVVHLARPVEHQPVARVLDPLVAPLAGDLLGRTRHVALGQVVVPVGPDAEGGTLDVRVRSRVVARRFGTNVRPVPVEPRREPPLPGEVVDVALDGGADRTFRWRVVEDPTWYGVWIAITPDGELYTCGTAESDCATPYPVET